MSEDLGHLSDGYHTFNELYEMRHALWIALCRAIEADPSRCHSEHVWRCKLNSDGTAYPGWFLLAITEESGQQLSFHLPLSKWDECDFAHTYEEPQSFDGHTSADVLERLRTL